MNQYKDIQEVAELLGVTPRRIRQQVAAGEFPGAKKVNGKILIPIMSHPKLVAAEAAEKTLGSEKLLDVAVDKREEAMRRLAIIGQFQKFAASYIANGGARSTSLDVFAGQSGIGKRTLQRWIRRCRDQGPLGLVDTRGGGNGGCRVINPDAFELFKSMYLTEQQLSVTTCWRNCCFVNKSQNKGWQIPSLAAMYNIIEKYIPLPVQVLHREGLAAYEARCAPYIQSDPDSVKPGQVWVGDHSQFNCWVRHRGKWVRPWLTAWQDMRSRMIVGRHISASPNQTTVLIAARRAIEKYGPPDSVKIDNGKDYDSEAWTGTTKVRRRAIKKGYIDELMVAGIYAMLDIGISFSIPYHPQSKPIERFFDTLDCQFTKTLSTYCGKDTVRRPDDLYKRLQNEKFIAGAYGLEEFADLVAPYVEVYNNSGHGGRGMAGRSPAEVMSTRSSQRVMAEGVLDLLLRVWSGELTVGKNGVRFKGMYYGQWNTELLMHQGRKVRAAYDPDDLSQVYVYDADTLKLLTIAEQNQLIQYGSAVSEEALREAMRRKSHALKITRQFADSRLAANMDLPTLTLRAMQDAAKKRPAEPAPKRLRPVRTALDGQVHEHKRQEAVKAVRKAAGAESIETVLDIDLSALKPKPKRETRRFDIFNERGHS